MTWESFLYPHDIVELKESERYVLRQYQEAMRAVPYNWRQSERLSNELVAIRTRIIKLEQEA